MKIVITEKQLKLLLSSNSKERDLGEADTPPNPDSTTTNSSGSSSYPDVGKWESGVVRGPANQIGNTKWSDIVGQKLVRGKANPLK